MDKATLGFCSYKTSQILKRFTGTFRRAQTLKLWGVSHLLSHNGSVKEAGEFGPRMKDRWVAQAKIFEPLQFINVVICPRIQPHTLSTLNGPPC